MKKLTLGLILVIIMVMAISCAKVKTESADLGWSVIKSPTTGICYETASSFLFDRGFMGMAEVDCKYYKGD